MINVFEPTTGQEEKDAVSQVLDSRWIGKWQKVAEFESAWASHLGVSPENVVSVNCATEGLFQICELLDLHYPDEVIIPSIHFIGAANAVYHTGATTRFCDVDKHTLNPTLEHIQAACSSFTTAVCLLHYGGVAQELNSIRQWCDSKGLWLIEDAACSPATIYKGKAAGTWGHFGVWSFDAMKILSTGDGGMIYCENLEHTKELRKRLYLGMNSTSGLSNDKDKWWEFEVSCPGRRATMNDIAAGIGLEQIKKLDSFVDRRTQIWSMYSEYLYDPGDTIQLPQYVKGNSYYFYWIQTPRRDELAQFLRANEIYSTFRYYPLHRVFKTGQNLRGVDYAADNTLLLPLHCNLTDNQVEYICDKIKEFFG